MTVTRQDYRALTDDEKDAVQDVKEIGEALLGLLDSLPISREVSIAKTKVEEAVMWAVKGITRS